MRTKTLLIAAAAIAAGIVTSSAQNVYSQNVVGYVNQVSNPNGFSLITNPLNTTNNTVASILKTPRLGMILYKFSGGLFQANSYDGAVWSSPSDSLNPGEGAFLFVPAGNAYTNTYVGEVLQGSLTNAVPQGFSILGSKVPQAGLVQTDLGFPSSLGSIVYKWTGFFNAFSYDGATWSPSQPSVNVGEGFFSFSPSAKNWVRTFTVQ
jgi:hypothetical protein